MCVQIADELGDRQDLLAPLSDSVLALSPIQNAVQSAISKWEREPFYFLESYQNLFNLVQGQEFYTAADAPAIATTPNIVILRVLLNSNRYALTKRTWEYLETISVNPAVQSSWPTDWAYFAAQIRIYPIPAQALPVQASYDQRLKALVNPTDSNVWTQDGYDLIRSEAKLILAQEVLHDDGITLRMKKAIYGDPSLPSDRGYLYALKAESSRRTGKSRIRPTQF